MVLYYSSIFNIIIFLLNCYLKFCFGLLRRCWFFFHSTFTLHFSLHFPPLLPPLPFTSLHFSSLRFYPPLLLLVFFNLLPFLPSLSSPSSPLHPFTPPFFPISSPSPPSPPLLLPLPSLPFHFFPSVQPPEIWRAVGKKCKKLPQKRLQFRASVHAIAGEGQREEGGGLGEGGWVCRGMEVCECMVRRALLY